MNLVKNVGKIDKTIRLLAGAALLLFSVFGLGISSVTGAIISAVGIILLLTGLINFCPLFKILGISSVKS